MLRVPSSSSHSPYFYPPYESSLSPNLIPSLPILRVASCAPLPPLSLSLSGGSAGRREDGLGGRISMYILRIFLAVVSLVCCCVFVADARLLSPSSAGFRRPPAPVAGSFSSAAGFHGGFLAGAELTKVDFNKEEGIVSGGAACISLSHVRGGAGEVDAVAAAGGHRSARMDGGSGSDLWTDGGGSTGATRRGRGDAVDLKFELEHGVEPRSTCHKAKGVSVHGELLNRLTKPAMAMVQARICWLVGEERDCRDLQGLLCNCLCLGVFSAFLPAYVFVLVLSPGFCVFLDVSSLYI